MNAMKTRSCLLTNLALKNYNAAAVGVTKLAPLNSKMVVEVGKQVKREISDYSNDPSNSLKNCGNLDQLTEFTNETLKLKKLPGLHTLVESSFRPEQ